MDDFESRFVQGPQYEYYIVLGGQQVDKDWLSIDPVVTDQPVFAPAGVVAIFSSPRIDHARRIGTPFELLCLSCFLHILRSGNGVRLAQLDGKYTIRILPWRSPCETTGVYEEAGNQYYLEGCRDSGVFWRNGTSAPTTKPPVVSCGAFDTNAGCWCEDCPHGAFFADDIEPFRARSFPTGGSG